MEVEEEQQRHVHQPSGGADVRVFVHNTYLLPSAMVALTAGNKTCTNQHIRAGLIGAEAQRHDIVALQEVWGSQVDKLDAALRPTHHIAEGCESSGAWWGLGMTASVLDTLRFYYNQNGGLWFAQSKELPCVLWRRHTFTVSETKSKKGVTAALLDMSKRWGEGSHLLFLNTHLDPMNDESKLAQLRQVRRFIYEVCTEVKGSMEFEKMAVMLVGDFNIPSHEKTYKRMQKILGARDLFSVYSQKKRGSKRQAYTYDGVENSLAMWQERARIDYAWAFDSLTDEVEDIDFMPIDVVSADIVKQARGEEWSDHWAQAFTIRPQT